MPVKVTVDPEVVTSIVRALTESSSAIFALIFAVSDASVSVCFMSAAAFAAFSPNSAPRSRAVAVLRVPDEPTAPSSRRLHVDPAQ